MCFYTDDKGQQHISSATIWISLLEPTRDRYTASGSSWKNQTKGIILRGYDNLDFPSLSITSKGNFRGEVNTLINNNISI